ncbi:6-bladed beta-propeller [Echinicola soli]|uniref:6-bladed beta-propeller n=1 Tax=Echinicola soli TaxID=2591634 RepID=A0A514CGZ6_9BACT|nr:6-bladed beta-propeller [Echinicola soli]QDH79089.1 6-bladed beta-propeller [Echinicola soli]
MIFNQLLTSLVTIVAFLIFSCTEKQVKLKEGGLENIIINTDEVKDTADISNWIKSFTITRLEEHEGQYLGMVNKVLVSPHHYVIVDKHDTDQIFLYDKKGNFIKSLIDLGSGPLEINQVNDCWFNNTATLEVYDYSLKKVVVYNEEYEPDSTYKTPPSILFDNIIPLTDGGYVAYKGYSGYNGPFEGKSYKVGFLNREFKLIATALTYPDELNRALITNPWTPFWKVKDTVRFYQNFNPYIYNILPNQQLTKRYKLNYQPNPLPENYEEEVILPHINILNDLNIPFQERNKAYEGYAGFSGQWYESQNLILFSSFDKKHKSFLTLYDKHKQKVITSAHSLADTQRFKTVLPPFQAFDAKNKTFVGVLQGWVILEYLLLKGSPLEHEIKSEKESNFLIKVAFN